MYFQTYECFTALAMGLPISDLPDFYGFALYRRLFYFLIIGTRLIVTFVNVVEFSR